MNKRQRKKAAKKQEQRELGAAIKALWEFELKGDEPCDDFSCPSCYVQAGPHYNFWINCQIPIKVTGRAC